MKGIGSWLTYHSERTSEKCNRKSTQNGVTKK